MCSIQLYCLLKIQIFLYILSLSRPQLDSLAHWPASLFMNLYHLYHQGLSVPAFCTLCNCILGLISHTWQCALFTGMLVSSFIDVQSNCFFSIFNPLHSGLCILKAVSIIFTKMEAWSVKLVLCYSSLCTKLIHTENWCACVQAIVSHQTNIYQIDLNSRHSGTG